MISISEKATGNDKKALNTELDDDTIKSINFEHDVTTVDYISDKTNSQTSPEEIQFSEIYITEIEQQAEFAKERELENWKKQNVYIEEKSKKQTCISTRWVLS